MSKSLKNFITIKDCLKNYTSRQLRLLFLYHNWSQSMDLSDNTLMEVKELEKRLLDFVSNIYYKLRITNINANDYTDLDQKYNEYIINNIDSINKSLLNNIDTKSVITKLLEGVTTTYKYLDNKFNITLVENYYNFLIKILNVFGIDVAINNNLSNEKIIDTIVNFRGEIRDILIQNKKDIPSNLLKEFFNKLDSLRNIKLKELGIIAEDIKSDNIYKWRYMI